MPSLRSRGFGEWRFRFFRLILCPMGDVICETAGRQRQSCFHGQTMSSRIIGLDLARSLAILGMCVVHFTLVMSSACTEPAWLVNLLALLDGRAAALFVVLAGIGVSLRSQRARQADDQHLLTMLRRSLCRRGVLLLFLGFLNLLIWQGDILRVYGVSMFIAAALLGASDRLLLLTAMAFIAGFLALFVGIDYSMNWDWESLTYHGLWQPQGLARNLFYDGFRSVFPWTGLFLLGMWLGHRDWSDLTFRRRILIFALIMNLATEGLSRGLISYFTANPSGMDAQTIRALFGTESIPPLPLFLCTAVSFAIVIIACCLWIAERFAAAWLIRALAATGQMALTWYISHIVLGLGFVVLWGWTEDQPLFVSISAAFGFFSLSMLVSHAWRSMGRPGPLEWLLRRITDQRAPQSKCPSF